MVLSKGGEVVFTENGQLADYQRIAWSCAIEPGVGRVS
jgi:hypothetical protein